MRKGIWERRREQAAKEAEGVVVTPSLYPFMQIRVRRLCDWNADFARALVRVAKLPKHRAQSARIAAAMNKPGYVTTDEDRAWQLALEREAFAEGCMIDWRGVPDDDGNELPFTLENAQRLIDTFPEVYVELRAAATDASRFEPMTDAQKVDAALKNS